MIRFLVAAAALGWPAAAAASFADVASPGGPRPGPAAVALADDASACHHNPAGLAAAAGPQLGAGYVLADARFRLDGERRELDAAGGMLAGGVLPLRLDLPGLETLALGFLVHAPPAAFAALHGRPPDRAALPFYENRIGRWTLLPAVAVGFGAGLSAGLALDAFAGLGGPVAVEEGSTGAIDARSAQVLRAAISPVAGLRWDAGRGFSIGLVYRSERRVTVETDARIDAGGTEIALRAAMDAFYRPHTLVAGLAWSDGDWTAALDLGWAHWSAWTRPWFVADVSWLGLDLAPATPAPALRDTFQIAAAAERSFAAGPARIALRIGYGWESPMVPGGLRDSALLDGHRHRVLAGLGLSFDAGDRVRLAIDAHLEAQILGSVETLVRGAAPDDPARTVEGEGGLVAAGLVVTALWGRP
jgi:hypothetical protein